MDNKFGFGRVKDNIERLKKELPTLLANQAENFFTETFAKHAWDDRGPEPWKEVKRRIPGTPEYMYPKKKGLSRRKSAILVRSGDLRRAVSNSIRSVSFEKTVLTVPLSYAAYQNDGTSTIPRRRFMGDSRTLRTMQIDKINKAIDKIWKR